MYEQSLQQTPAGQHSPPSIDRVRTDRQPIQPSPGMINLEIEPPPRTSGAVACPRRSHDARNVAAAWL